MSSLVLKNYQYFTEMKSIYAFNNFRLEKLLITAGWLTDRLADRQIQFALGVSQIKFYNLNACLYSSPPACGYLLLHESFYSQVVGCCKSFTTSCCLANSSCGCVTTEECLANLSVVLLLVVYSISRNQALKNYHQKTVKKQIQHEQVFCVRANL